MSRRSSAEILAPAGSPEALIAAVRCGADAVYLGGKTLNARRNAGNFGSEEMKEACGYCRARGVKVHLTLNTLVFDDEFRSVLPRAVEEACLAGVDAVIVQDPGVAAYIRQAAPDMPLHASTQMSVHTLTGVEKAAELGFSRVVLARELSFDEIKEIASRSPIETEVFVHGALCMCVSGQCLLSAMLGSRSANRGLCAQPCRLPFSARGGTGHDLSLKDLSVIDRIGELAEAGVTSFKIEGRMKRPEYVAAAVTACRNALEGKEDPVLREELKNVFSRSGFTDGYIAGKRGREMFGIRRKEDVEAASGTLRELRKLYEKERQSLPVDFFFTAGSGEPATLAAKCGAVSVFGQTYVAAEKAEKVSLSAERVTEQLKKCGGTPFFPNEIECDIDPGLSLPLSAVNSLRRAALDGITDKLKQAKQCSFSQVIVENPVKKVKKPRFYARFASMDRVWKSPEHIRKIILPLDEAAAIDGFEVAAELPTVFFGREDAVLERLMKAMERGVGEAYAATLDGAKLCEKAGVPYTLGLGSNIINTISLREAERMGAAEALLSPEIRLTEASRLGGDIPRGIAIYGRLPLMTFRNCPVRNGMSCAECKKRGSLTDRLGKSFPVVCDEGYSRLLNSCPLYMGDRMDEIDFVDFGLFYFTVESREEAGEIIRRSLRGEPFDGEYTRGLYYRGVE